jgi:outer membrane receptor protein involved in Fe transport
MSFDVGGKVTENLTLLANIAWTDVRIVKHVTTPSLIGTRPLGGQNAPARSSSLAARYNFRKGLLAGVRLGLTYQFAAEYLRIGPSATATAITVPFFNAEVSEWSAVIGYTFKKWQNGTRLDLSLNVNNLFDQKEMTTAAYYPEGRTVRLTAGLRF